MTYRAGRGCTCPGDATQDARDGVAGGAGKEECEGSEARDERRGADTSAELDARDSQDIATAHAALAVARCL